MKRPQLYIRKDNGRYEPYREPQATYDNRLYRRVVRGGRVSYEPCSMLMTDDLGEGVWVVTKGYGTKSIMEGKYMCRSFMCLKASDIQEVSLAKLGGAKKLSEYLVKQWDNILKNLPLGYTSHDLANAIIGTLLQYEEEKDKK